MKLVFWGFNKMGESVARFFKDEGFDVVGVVVAVNDPEKIAAMRAIVGEKAFIGVIGEYSANELREKLESLAPELMISCSFRKRIPRELLRINGVPIYNIHGGRLPFFRGGNMLNWSIIIGEKEMMLSLHIVEETLDTGDVLAEQAFPINWTDDANVVKNAMNKALIQLLSNNLGALKQHAFSPRKQDHTQARYYPARGPGDGLIHWDKNASEVYNLARALVEPFPGAFSFYNGQRVIIERAEVVFDNKVYYKHGRIIKISKDGLLVTTGFNLLLIKELRGMSLQDPLFSEGGVFENKAIQ